MERDRRSPRADRADTIAGRAGVPGKQTLAQRGVAGVGSALPHREAIQRSFGPDHDLSQVRAHIGGDASTACEQLGARGYATGRDVAFRAQPDVALAAHEAAHVVQQRAGVSFSGVGSPDDAHERVADQVAARVVAGQPATDLLPRGGSGAISGPGTAVQCFHELSASERGEKEGWDTGGKAPLRVSDDGMLAVLQETDTGSHMLWADPSLFRPANTALIAAGSPIGLQRGSDVLTGLAPGTGEPRKLSRVEPEHETRNQREGAIEMPDDCGVCAHEVTGAGETPLRARTHDAKSGHDQLTTTTSPLEMKREILLPELRAKSAELKQGKLAQLFKQKRDLVDEKKLAALDRDIEEIQLEGKEVDREVAERRKRGESEPDIAAWRKPQLDKLVERQKLLLKKIDELLVTAYQELEPAERSEIEQRLGINAYADPQLGEAFTIVTGGEPHHKGAFTYNHHWAAVIMKSGGDAVTMENSARHKSERNTNWSFQMYGVPTRTSSGGKVAPKPGQSFHEQQRDLAQAHGKQPTTLVAHNGPLASENPKDEE